MKVSVFKRTTGKKGETNRIRREGNIPAVLYANNVAPETIYVNGDEVRTILRNMKQGQLSTTVFELHQDKKTHKAIVKDIQYQVATYDVEHIDFLLLSDNVPVTVNVPITVTGAADCAGIKLGGFLRQAIRTLKVSCLPKHIPQEFVVDVRDMNVADSKRLSEIALPETVKPLGRMTEVAIVVAKKAGT